MTDSNLQDPTQVKPSFGRRIFKLSIRVLVTFVLPVIIVLAAVGFYKHQIDTRPQAQRRAAGRQTWLVTVEPVRLENRAAMISAMGTVKAATEITLTPEVTGIVNFMDSKVLPGGLVKAGQILYRIDSRDYETIVQQRQSEVARAELALRLEQGNQTVARQEYELLGDLVEDQDRELVLRQPHLQEAQESLASAKAALAKAKLDVERCIIRSPFNAVIKTKHADVGARVSPTAPLAVLTGTDEYWVETLVSINQLTWIQFPVSERSEGSRVLIRNPSVWREEQYREGRVLHLMGQLEEAGRLAQVIVSVPDPMGIEGNSDLPPLLIGSYVRVDIEGVSIPDVIVLPREYIHEDNSVRVMNDQDALEIRRVEIVFRGREEVFVSKGLFDGDRVVTSDLSAPVDGMPLQIKGAIPQGQNSNTAGGAGQ
jgi:RND family efflux transporter MFP subunit